MFHNHIQDPSLSTGFSQYGVNVARNGIRQSCCPHGYMAVGQGLFSTDWHPEFFIVRGGGGGGLTPPEAIYNLFDFNP